MHKHFVRQEKMHLENFDTNHQEIVEIFDIAEVEEIKKMAFEEGQRVGFQKGFLEGKDKSISDYEQEIKNTLLSACDIFNDLKNMQQEYNNQFSSHFFYAVYAVFKKVLPVYIASYGKDELHNFVKKLLSKVLNKKDLILTVNGEQHDTIKDLFMKTDDTFESITFKKGKNFSMNQCELKWEDGGATFNLEDFYEKIDMLFREAKKEFSDFSEKTTPNNDGESL